MELGWRFVTVEFEECGKVAYASSLRFTSVFKKGKLEAYPTWKGKLEAYPTFFCDDASVGIGAINLESIRKTS